MPNNQNIPSGMEVIMSVSLSEKFTFVRLFFKEIRHKKISLVRSGFYANHLFS